MLSMSTPPTTTAQDARRAARNAGTLAAASIISKGALFGWQLILIPLLGPFEYGIYGTVGALFAIGMPVTSFAMGLIVIRDVARFPEKAGRYWTAMLFMQTVLGLLAYISINTAAAVLDYGPTIQAFVALAGISLLVDMLGNMGNELLLAQERMLHTSVVEVGHIALRLALAGGALVLGFGLTGIYIVTIFSGVLRWWVLWAVLLRTGVRPHFPLDRAVALPLLINSAPLALNAFLGLAYQHADKLMTTYFIGERDTGYLTAAFVVVFGVIEILGTTVLVATFPMLSRYYGTPTFGFILEKLLFFTALISLPVSLVISVFGADIFVPLFGEAYRPVAGILAILIWYTTVTMMGNVLARGMMAQNKQRVLLLVQGGSLGINLTLNALLLPRLGVRGTSVATLIAEIISFTVLLYVFRETSWNPRRMLPRLGRLALLGLAAALAMLALRALHPVAGILFGGLVYGLGLRFGPVLAADDWDLLYRLAAAMPGGTLLLRYWKRDIPLNW